jgi:hypothetical protein
MGAGASAKAGGGSSPSKQLPGGGPEYLVETYTEIEGVIGGGEKLILRITNEALVLVHPQHQKPLTHYPYHTIMCWGHSNKTFQFRIFKEGSDPDTLRFGTDKGKELETVILSTVKSLMADMEAKAVGDVEFRTLLKSIQGEPDSSMRMTTIKQFISTHHFIARHGVELLRAVAPDTFDMIDIATFMHERIINKDSFQLLLNEFPSKEDRENVCHRLGIKLTNEAISVECPEGLVSKPKHAEYKMDLTCKPKPTKASKEALENADRVLATHLKNLEGKLQTVTVIIKRKSEDIGLSLECKTFDEFGGHPAIVIEEFVKDMPAHAAHERGEIQQGDLILQVNGQSVVGLELSNVTPIFKASSDDLEILFGRFVSGRLTPVL